MEKYREYVKLLSNEKINKCFINSDQDHALEVFVQLFKQSKSLVRILAGGLCSEVTNRDEYIEAISNFIEQGGTLNILLNGFDEKKAVDSNLIKRLAYYQLEGKPVYVRKTMVKPYFQNDPDKKEIHFTIGDSQSYRIETDTVKRTAICNFNDEKVATQTGEIFDSIFSSSEKLDLVSLFNL